MRPESISTTIAAVAVMAGGLGSSRTAAVILSLATWVEADAGATGPRSTTTASSTAASRDPVAPIAPCRQSVILKRALGAHEGAVARPLVGGDFMATLSPILLTLLTWYRQRLRRGYSSRLALCMTTGSLGTSEWGPDVPVGTWAMASTTSIPSATSPNTA